MHLMERKSALDRANIPSLNIFSRCSYPSPLRGGRNFGLQELMVHSVEHGKRESSNWGLKKKLGSWKGFQLEV